MDTLNATTLLKIWERGHVQAPVERALVLLAAAFPETPAEELAALPIGRRDGLLLLLHEQLFGAQLEGVARCPDCGCGVELHLATNTIRVDAAPPGPDDLLVQAEQYAVQLRLPTSADLAASAASGNPAQARHVLLERCIVAASHAAQACPVEMLPATVVAAIGERLAAADPQADIRLRIQCPDCGAQWRAGFDILAFLWSAIDRWAQQTLYDVHVLARAYGWREPDVLALSPYRRQYYLDMVGA